MGNFVSLKFTSKNFLLWKTQILGLIESQDMLGFVNGATPMPKSHVSKDEDVNQEKENPDYVVWRRSDRLLCGWITGTLSEEALGLVVGLETSAEVWKDGHSMADYIRIFKNICDDLAAIGKVVDDRAKVFGLLRGLGSDLESFITAMLKPPIPPCNDLIQLLQGHETMKTLHQTSKSPNLNMAFMVNRNDGYGGGSSNGFLSHGNNSQDDSCSSADEDTLGKPTTSTPLHVSETQSLEDMSLGTSSLPNVSCATTPSHSSTPANATDVTLTNEEVHNPDPFIPVDHIQQEEAAIDSEPLVPSTNSSPIATRQSHSITKPNSRYFNDDFCFIATSLPKVS
ncbi:hypothetical protein COLO4_38403 [Corchorus olitorius]|uniref:Retrotransposon Copia-like N-terminal domain-containing protein n=1 Tax=Corchorus olitorius TaxID=93759 RepID=A0A1R3FV75_9ROSI|nr:hypothetical protein COLO4_38403 [Corchorus olitorius]